MPKNASKRAQPAALGIASMRAGPRPYSATYHGGAAGQKIHDAKPRMLTMRNAQPSFAVCSSSLKNIHAATTNDSNMYVMYPKPVATSSHAHVCRSNHSDGISTPPPAV